MATDAPNELHAFYRFLAGQLQEEGSTLTPEQSVEAFRTYQRELDRLKREIEPAVEQFESGEGRDLDYQAIKEEVTHRLAQKGVTD